MASSLSEGTLEEVLSIQTSVGREFRSESLGCVYIDVCERDVNVYATNVISSFSI